MCPTYDENRSGVKKNNGARVTAGYEKNPMHLTPTDCIRMGRRVEDESLYHRIYITNYINM